jgi:hypothetical protein
VEASTTPSSANIFTMHGRGGQSKQFLAHKPLQILPSERKDSMHACMHGLSALPQSPPFRRTFHRSLITRSFIIIAHHSCLVFQMCCLRLTLLNHIYHTGSTRETAAGCLVFVLSSFLCSTSRQGKLWSSSSSSRLPIRPQQRPSLPCTLLRDAYPHHHHRRVKPTTL